MNSADDLQDRLLRHQVWLTRFSSGLVNRIMAILNGNDAGLAARLREQLELLEEIPEQQAERRAQSLEAIVNQISDERLKSWDDVEELLASELNELAVSEADFVANAVEFSLPVELKTVKVPVEQLRNAVTRRPFQGRHLKEWASSLAAADRQRLASAIRQGVVEGRTIDEMVRQVRGTRSAKFEDGILQISRRQAEAVVRTAVNHTTNAARNDVFEANSDIIQGVKWVATLDGRTSAICRARDGHIAPVGDHGDDLPDDFPRLVPKNARPPAHVNCRSTTVAVFDINGIADRIGERPFVRDTRTRRKREKDFRAEAKAAVGNEEWSRLSEKDRRRLISDRRREWTAKNVGQVPSSTTYDDWLRRQPVEFQDEVLGKGRAKLFRDGLKIDRFVDRNGRQLTLKELRKADAAGNIPRKTPRLVPVEHLPGTTKAFRDRIDATVRKLPDGIQKKLRDQAVKIETGELLTDIRRDLRGKRPRGWPKGMTWDNAEGAHSAGRVSVSEKLRTRSGQVRKSERIEGVLRHEIGHALDDSLLEEGSFSASEEFLRAYRKDKKRMTGEVRRNFAYFLQAGIAGPREAFAEVFAVSQGGGASSNVDGIKEAFAESLSVIREMIRRQRT